VIKGETGYSALKGQFKLSGKKTLIEQFPGEALLEILRRVPKGNLAFMDKMESLRQKDRGYTNLN